MKLSNQIAVFALGAVALISTGCAVFQNNAQPTRAATQTPFIIFVPVTTTPEPATVTPLPTITAATAATPTRTATRVVAAKPTATRTKTSAPVAAGPSPTTATVCTYGTPTVTEPDKAASIMTREDRPAMGSSFVFKWIPPSNIAGDDIGYKIHMDATSTTGKPVNSVNVYISHNKFVSESQKQQCGGQSCFIYDPQRVWYLKQGSVNSIVTYYIAVVKFNGSIDDLGNLSGTASECNGSQSEKRSITLIVQ